MRSPQPDLPTADIQPVIRRAVACLCAQHDWAVLHEMPLPNGRRADIMALCPAGRLTCIEIKSGLPDFRSDLKWPQYRPWCDAFYFAVPHSFPQTVLPDDVGVMVVDVAAASGYGPAIADAAIIRPAPMHKLAAARRRSVTHRFAMLAAQRLNRMEDPALATVLRTALRSE
ncbi:MmcB family DNA repair protein [Gluconacetobacter entanii]|uniref:MmcB family DNA repair protein n=1 Tax=Gluconacetobacter entanii TaxID=108528 RepID=UPI001C933451|nr:MmcB family DNA repair protein [Gluconacetobacter entanii]MBY4641416.1 MmcB family DNA repair protein [Gluconacetobacter entanii]MCW4580975.1 MmcB family DNA repair protein [Gluconacetobacter entanii]MCW4583400.1 MmcB family DNA repair protein [Gluconacetobacter entanii]MCW4587604.1 MmcB family DNA repair protein [Gluconacetobacter entanii]